MNNNLVIYMPKLHQKKYHYIFFILFFLFVSVLLHNKSYKEYPSKIHTWAQSDHYVLALGFLDNTFDFFHPKTYSKNHQFPPKEKKNDNNAITAADFPLPHYSAAILMKIFDSRSPWIFRLVTLLGSFLALFFLFKTVLEQKGFWLALLLTSFILFIPVYSYYQNGFLPSMMAFNSLLLGISFVLKYEFSSKNKYWYLAVLFLTLAALLRFTQVIFLLSLIGVIFLRILQQKKFDIRIITSLFGLILVVSYFLYNRYLASNYGSVFLNKPILPDSFKDWFFHAMQQSKMYVREVFTLLHVAILVLAMLVLRKSENSFKLKISFLSQWLILSILGVILFNLLMSWSMSVHDYYALDTWIPVMTLTLAVLILKMDLKAYKRCVPFMSVVLIIGMLNYAVEKQYWKYKFVETPAEMLIDDFYKSADFLDEHLKESKEVLIICGNGWNTPMVRWNREVFRIAWKYEEQIPLLKNETYEYIITYNLTFEEIVLRNEPDYLKHFQLVADNSKVSIWKPRN